MKNIGKRRLLYYLMVFLLILASLIGELFCNCPA